MEKLIQIGFNVGEAKIYLELLKIGPQGASVLSSRVAMNRCTTYTTLKTLERRGIVSSYKNSGVRFYIPNDPNALIAYVDRQCRTFDYYKSDLLAVLPQFRDLGGVRSFDKPIFSYFEGMEGVKHVMYDALLSGDECLHVNMHDFLMLYTDLHVGSEKLHLKAIAPDSVVLRNFFDTDCIDGDGMVEILYVRTEVAGSIFRDKLMIYGNKVAMLHLDSGHEYGVVIESEEIASMQRAMFAIAWSALMSDGEIKTY